MNKTIALIEFNKRASVTLNEKEFALIEDMMSFDKEKVQGAFITLTGREVTVADIDLAILIIELSKALTPPMQIIRTGGGGDIWPSPSIKPYRSTFGGGDIMCASH